MYICATCRAGSGIATPTSPATRSSASSWPAISRPDCGKRPGQRRASRGKVNRRLAEPGLPPETRSLLQQLADDPVQHLLARGGQGDRRLVAALEEGGVGRDV